MYNTIMITITITIIKSTVDGRSDSHLVAPLISTILIRLGPQEVLLVPHRLQLHDLFVNLFSHLYNLQGTTFISRSNTMVCLRYEFPSSFLECSRFWKMFIFLSHYSPLQNNSLRIGRPRRAMVNLLLRHALNPANPCSCCHLQRKSANFMCVWALSQGKIALSVSSRLEDVQHVKCPSPTMPSFFYGSSHPLRLRILWIGQGFWIF